MGHAEQGPIVLIIDDEPVICELFARALAASGFFPVTTQTAEAAVHLIEGGLHPDAILLDLVMPGMGGLGFLLQLRGNPTRNRIPVAIVTGNSVIPSALERAATALDAEIHLKPLEIEAILALTERLVQGSDRRVDS
jgi:CheY-like chemotaxis protein